MKLTQIDLAEGRGGSQREMPASEAVARAEEACGGTLLLFEPDGVPRAAVAICPGGGFGKVNTEHEGVAFAEWFVAHGIAAGVVKYRLPEGDPALPPRSAVIWRLARHSRSLRRGVPISSCCFIRW